MTKSNAFWASRIESVRAETGSVAHRIEANDHAMKKTVAYAISGWSRKTSGVPASRFARVASHASARMNPAALTNVSPVVGEPGSVSKNVTTTKNASPAARFR